MSCCRTVGASSRVLDEADETIGEVVLRPDLLREHARDRPRADDQHALLEVRVVRETVERDAPRRDRDDEARRAP